MAKDNRRGFLLTRLAGFATSDNIKAEMLRVDHAGEYGAVHIYRGQIATLAKTPQEREVLEIIYHMAEQEKIHLAKFNSELPKRNIRPSLLSPVWKMGGFLMGAITTLVSRETAMACTEAVETVIGKHYAEQIQFFKHHQDVITPDLEKFCAEELEHLQEAVTQDAHHAPFYRLTNSLIQKICKMGICVAQKV